ncbi:zinc-ribbon domain-containing protein [Vitreoscilla stercoraria]|uniref:zinc-ribbon domain-containing protein n=1 Tax=Vitreoscilla TaxID=59 RepID=UPI0003A85C29
MIFIFGVQPKKISETEGLFNCPICQTQTTYRLSSSRSHLSIFFLPLFPIGKPNTTFVCLQCGTSLPEKFIPSKS